MKRVMKGDYQRMGTTKNDNSPETIQGKCGVYTIGKEIGSGGNGRVCNVKVKCAGLLHEDEQYVIKILSLNRIKTDSEKKKRLERFENEIHTVQKLMEKEINVIPIYDSFLNENCDDTKHWYLMPKAQEYCVKNKEDSLTNVKRMIDLGETIKKLHDLGKSHRDIKPSNIMLYRDRCYLTDFGLVWGIEDCFGITEDHDDIGPIDIRPPEMENIDTKLNINIDYRKVDVYLFAKTIWMYLKSNRKGFKGEYNQSDPYMSLDKNTLNLGDTISPLHDLMIKATKHVNSERIDIGECINLLNQQLSIATNTCDPKLLNSLKFDEAVKEVLSQVDSDVFEYEQMDKIVSIINILNRKVSISIDDFGQPYDLGLLDSSTYMGDKVLKLSFKSTRYIILYVLINKISVSKKGIIEIYNESMEEYKTIPCLSVDEIMKSNYKEVGLTGQYKIFANEIM